MVNLELTVVNYICLVAHVEAMGGKSLSVEKLLRKTSKECGLFSNPLRSLIAALITAKAELTWTELKTSLEKETGKVNPNTLSFHLSELANAGFIEKIDVRGQPRYRATKQKLTDMQKLLGEDLLQAVKAKL